MNQGDLRDEKFTQLGSTLARFGPTPVVPSPNLAYVIAAMEDGELKPIFAMADKIEAGAATGSEAESLDIYEMVPKLAAYVKDLAEMCRRREDALASLDINIGNPHRGRS